MPRRPHDSLAARLDALDPEARRAAVREFEDLRIARARRRRALDRGDLGTAGVEPPASVAALDAEAPGASRLWLTLPDRCTVPEAVEHGARIGMDRAAVAAALDALRRAELVLDGPGGLVLTAPGSQPF